MSYSESLACMLDANFWKAAVVVKSLLLASSYFATSNYYSIGMIGVIIFLTTKHSDWYPFTSLPPNSDCDEIVYRAGDILSLYLSIPNAKFEPVLKNFDYCELLIYLKGECWSAAVTITSYLIPNPFGAVCANRLGELLLLKDSLLLFLIC